MLGNALISSIDERLDHQVFDRLRIPADRKVDMQTLELGKRLQEVSALVGFGFAENVRTELAYSRTQRRGFPDVQHGLVVVPKRR